MSAMRKSAKNRRRKVIDCVLFACSNQKYQYSIVVMPIYGITHCLRLNIFLSTTSRRKSPTTVFFEYVALTGYINPGTWSLLS